MKKTSLSSLIWTILLIVLLACFAIVVVVSSRKADVISSNINILRSDSPGYQKLDSCISLLYDAENNSRLFVLTLDSSYNKKYAYQLGAVSQILHEYETQNVKSSQLSGLIRKKRIDSQEFIHLKILVDSLLAYTLQDVPQKYVRQPVKPEVIRNTEEIIQKDSLLTATKKTRKGLLKRIADAIANKESADSLIRLSESRMITQDSALVPPVVINEKPDFYKPYNSARHELNKREKELLRINEHIFKSLQSALQGLRIQEEKQRETDRNIILEATSEKLDEFRDLSFGSIAVVLLLAMIIIWNLIRLYKNEKTILNYAELTAENTRKKGVFMAQVAHEIRTPLNSVIGFSQLIDTQNMDESLKVNVNAIKSSSRILLTLVNEILDFSKFESGNINLLKKRISPPELLNDATSILSVLADQKTIEISTHFDFKPDLALIGDDFRIKQIVINLLTNAVKFTPSGGKVSIQAFFKNTDPKNGVLTIRVKDSGVGIAIENQQKIFDDFIQIDMIDSSSRHLGTGLGLAICKRITDLYGGNISVNSAPGKGSEFEVTLPLQVATAEARQEDEINKSDMGSALNGKKILIVDDTKINLILISKIMDKYQVNYDLAGNGMEAFGLFEQHQFDLIITDIQMPEMDGIELTRQIREYPDTQKSSIPILGFTGSSSDENRVHLKGIGMNDVLGKPFEEKQLIDIISRLFN